MIHKQERRNLHSELVRLSHRMSGIARLPSIAKFTHPMTNQIKTGACKKP